MLIEGKKIRGTLPETEELEIKLIEKLNLALKMYNVRVTDMKDLESTLGKLIKSSKIQSFEEIVQLCHAYMMMCVTIDEHRAKLEKEKE